MEVDLFSLLPEPSVKREIERKPEKNYLFDLMANNLKEVNKLAKDSEKLTEDLVFGRLENLHDLMIAAEKASVALNFTMAIRDHAIRAYQEIMGFGR